MNGKNSRKLKKGFPKLYPTVDPLSATGYEWSFQFDIGDGWFQLLWELSEKLEVEIVRLIEEGILIEDLPSVQQVKEKYGELCFYASGTDKMQKDIAIAEKKSLTICELCGAIGKLNVDLATEPIHTWLMVRCSEHWGITPAQWNKMQWDKEREKETLFIDVEIMINTYVFHVTKKITAALEKGDTNLVKKYRSLLSIAKRELYYTPSTSDSLKKIITEYPAKIKELMDI